jgi:hypothetical protein
MARVDRCELEWVHRVRCHCFSLFRFLISGSVFVVFRGYSSQLCYTRTTGLLFPLVARSNVNRNRVTVFLNDNFCLFPHKIIGNLSYSVKSTDAWKFPGKNFDKFSIFLNSKKKSWPESLHSFFPSEFLFQTGTKEVFLFGLFSCQISKLFKNLPDSTRISST